MRGSVERRCDRALAGPRGGDIQLAGGLAGRWDDVALHLGFGWIAASELYGAEIQVPNMLANLTGIKSGFTIGNVAQSGPMRPTEP